MKALLLILALCPIFALRSPAMDAATILNSIETALASQVQANGGTLTLAETLEDALEMLATPPNGWRVVLTMDGDEPREDTNPAGVVTGKLVAYVQAPKGLERPRRSLTHASRNAVPSFFTRRDWFIRKLRGVTLSHAEIDAEGILYKGSTWLKVEATPLWRTMVLNFELVYALDDPATDPDGTDPVVLPSPFKIVGATDEFYTISLSGVAHGRVPRFAPGLSDPTGTATGYAITEAAEEFYAVAYDGAPHGRIPRFVTA
jgi:hypothetical protein